MTHQSAPGQVTINPKTPGYIRWRIIAWLQEELKQQHSGVRANGASAGESWALIAQTMKRDLATADPDLSVHMLVATFARMVVASEVEATTNREGHVAVKLKPALQAVEVPLFEVIIQDQEVIEPSPNLPRRRGRPVSSSAPSAEATAATRELWRSAPLEIRQLIATLIVIPRPQDQLLELLENHRIESISGDCTRLLMGMLQMTPNMISNALQELKGSGEIFAGALQGRTGPGVRTQVVYAYDHKEVPSMSAEEMSQLATIMSYLYSGGTLEELDS